MRTYRSRVFLTVLLLIVLVAGARVPRLVQTPAGTTLVVSGFADRPALVGQQAGASQGDWWLRLLDLFGGDACARGALFGTGAFVLLTVSALSVRRRDPRAIPWRWAFTASIGCAALLVADLCRLRVLPVGAGAAAALLFFSAGGLLIVLLAKSLEKLEVVDGKLAVFATFLCLSLAGRVVDAHRGLPGFASWLPITWLEIALAASVTAFALLREYGQAEVRFKRKRGRQEQHFAFKAPSPFTQAAVPDMVVVLLAGVGLDLLLAGAGRLPSTSGLAGHGVQAAPSLWPAAAIAGAFLFIVAFLDGARNTPAQIAERFADDEMEIVGQPKGQGAMQQYLRARVLQFSAKRTLLLALLLFGGYYLGARSAVWIHPLTLIAVSVFPELVESIRDRWRVNRASRHYESAFLGGISSAPRGLRGRTRPR